MFVIQIHSIIIEKKGLIKHVINTYERYFYYLNGTRVNQEPSYHISLEPYCDNDNPFPCDLENEFTSNYADNWIKYDGVILHKVMDLEYVCGAEN